MARVVLGVSRESLPPRLTLCSLQDALESAMKNGLWGHALLLASKMDSRTHARVMTRYSGWAGSCWARPAGPAAVPGRLFEAQGLALGRESGASLRCGLLQAVAATPCSRRGTELSDQRTPFFLFRRLQYRAREASGRSVKG